MASREPCAAFPLPVNTAANGQVSTYKQLRIAGWSASETAGTACRVQLRDGGTSGTIIGVIGLAANGTNSQAFAHEIIIQNGLYATVVGAGTVEGAVYIGG